MDEQVEILRAIWNEMKALNGRVTTTNSRLDDLKLEVIGVRSELKSEIGDLRSELKSEIGELRSDLRSEVGSLRSEMSGMRQDIDLVHRRSVERDMRLGTALAELSHDVRDLTHVVHDWRDEHRLDRADLRDRVERLERRVGLEPR